MQHCRSHLSSLMFSQVFLHVNHCFYWCRWGWRNFLVSMTEISHGRRFWNLVVLCFWWIVRQLTWKINGETCAKEAQPKEKGPNKMLPSWLVFAFKCIVSFMPASQILFFMGPGYFASKSQRLCILKTDVILLLYCSYVFLLDDHFYR